VSSLASRLETLKRRAAEVATALTSLADRRKSYSLAASEGDERARKQISDIDIEFDSLKREETTVLSALECGEALAKQQAIDAAGEQQRQRDEQAYKASRAVIALNAEIDEELVRLRQLFERRAHLLSELAACGERERALAVRLTNKAGPTAAAQMAGLSRFLNLEMTPTAAVRPLTTANEILLTIGALPDGDGKSNGKLLPRPVTKRAVHD
jgi:hypothetical protein